MRVLTTTFALCIGLALTPLTPLSLTAQERQGIISSVTAVRAEEAGTFRFTIRGTNPCAAVLVDFGDGTQAVTYPINGLPTTITREFTRVGTFEVRVRGTGTCGGTAVATTRVTAVGNQPSPGNRGQSGIRFAGMDANRDGVITRAEWRGSQRSFEVHDWNGDGQLSGDEVRTGATWPSRAGNPADFNDWSQSRFTWLDVNKDNRISRSEWRYDTEDFYRADRNGDNVLTLREFLVGNEDDDRGDRFQDLDLNGDGRLDRNEWHGSMLTFTWLDRNRDNVLSRAEVAGSNALGTGTTGGTQVAPRTIVVSARQAWQDTGIDVRVGDLISVSPTGTIMFTSVRSDTAPPAGAAGMATAAAPRPDLHIGALLGRIGADGQPFLVGASLDSMRATRAGRLYLGVNDDRLDDNSGQFRAVVSVIRR